MTQIETPDAGDARWLTMRLRLWPDGSEAEHLRYMAEGIARGHFVSLALAPDGSAVGFVEASKRVDYVNGTSSSPVAFLEGLYVEPGLRRRGVARALVAEVEAWAAREGCSELASDSPLANVAAHAVHRALGFTETERVVYFCRRVPSPHQGSGGTGDDPSIAGMTVNERLHHFGLLATFDDAIRVRDKAAAVATLIRARFSPEQAEYTASQVLSAPNRYGY
jgi:aminoglycoside 6'-N-acetyltransferase I